TLKSDKEVDVEVALLAKEKGVVLFLVPKADISRLTFQTIFLSSVVLHTIHFPCPYNRGFRDIYAEFTSAKYDVYCTSTDPPAVQSKWQEKSLLSDPERKPISALRANDKGKTKRSHFVFAQTEEDR
ncbi:hypothetical protein F5051DRAFT_325535, partial [Lentinula edodes]